MPRTRAPNSLAKATHFGDGARVDRFELAPGIDVIIFEYRNTAGTRRSAVSDRLDIGVQLSGELSQDSQFAGVTHCSAGGLHVVAHGESYDVAYQAAEAPGLAVYFSIDESVIVPDEPDREVRLSFLEPQARREVQELAARLHVARRVGDAIDGEATREALLGWLRRWAALSMADPIVRARKEIESSFASDLYLSHLAESVGMHSTTFLRRFARRYGVTPVQYRLKVRLNHADRLAGHRPLATTTEIAAECGFSNPSYFHRAFGAYFGASMTRRRRSGG